MATTIITVACAKGGCTKTTTSMMLAGLLARRGHQTAVLDADNTGGATKWAMYVLENGEQLPFPVTAVNRVTLDRKLIERQYPDHWVFIDTPPSDTGTIQKAIDAADLTIIPTQPSIVDLRLAGETYEATPNAVVLLARVKPNTILTRDALAELDGAQIARFETVISEREEMKRIYGTTRVDLKEYSSVAQELIDLMAQIGKEQ